MSQRRNEAVSKQRHVLSSAAEAKRRFACEGRFGSTVRIPRALSTLQKYLN
jgi:hypothetical protein